MTAKCSLCGTLGPVTSEDAARQPDRVCCDCRTTEPAKIEEVRDIQGMIRKARSIPSCEYVGSWEEGELTMEKMEPGDKKAFHGVRCKCYWDGKPYCVNPRKLDGELIVIAVLLIIVATLILVIPVCEWKGGEQDGTNQQGTERVWDL